MRYDPYKDNTYRERMYLRIEMYPSFRRVFQHDITEGIMKDLKNIVDPEFQFMQNTIMNLSGGTGSGKSNVLMSLGKEIFPHFSYKNIFFFDQEIIDNADNFKKNTLIIRDENPQRAIFGEGSVATASQLSLMAETCRKAGLNLGFIEPSYVKTPISKLILETVDMDVQKRITRLAVRDTVTEHYMGAMYVKVLPEDDVDWIKYNIIKDDFIDKMKKGEMTGAKMNYNKIVEKSINDPEFKKYKSKGEQKAYLVSKYNIATLGQIRTILDLITVRLRENGNKKE